MEASKFVYEINFYNFILNIFSIFNFQTSSALIYDAVHVLTLGLASLQSPLRPTNLSCEAAAPWDDGLTLYNYISSVSFVFIKKIYLKNKFSSKVLF